MKSNPMGRILSEFKRAIVPKTLTMDRFKIGKRRARVTPPQLSA